MKALLIFSTLYLLILSASAQQINPAYDSTLAKTLGADDYGMKGYVLVILKTGSRQVEDKALRDSLFAGHLRNIRRLADFGKLTVAGPLGKNENSYRGIFILNVTGLEEARELLQTDPTIKEQLLEAQMYTWYGAAALPEYLKTQEKIEKFKFE